MELNEQQNRAVYSLSDHILVIAGPGTGKTRVMVNRVARLIKEGVSGHTILMLTFTNKAALEMKERIASLVSENEVRKIWIGTFHAIGLRILSQYGELLGYKVGLTVYDETDQTDIIKMLINESSLKISPTHAKHLLNDHYSGKTIDPSETIFFELFNFYRKFLRKNNSLDFGMILIETSRLLKEFEDIQTHYQNLFNHTMVDEYQDTDYTQYSLHHLINSENLFCVGDPDQTIYSWRGSSVDIILDFNKEDNHRDAEVIVLDKNYRSTHPIVNASNQLIANNHNRYDGKVNTAVRDGQDVCKKMIVNEGSSQIMELLNNLHNGGYAWGDMAILSRKHTLLQDLTNDFLSLNIPHQIVGRSKSLFNDHNIRQILRIMKLIQNHSDNFSCFMAINWPVQRYTNLQIIEIELEAMKNSTSFFEELAKREKEEGLFSWLITYKEKNIKTVLESIGTKLNINNSDYYLGLMSYINGWEHEEKSLSNFLTYISTKNMQDDIKEKVEKVTLSTIHAAKGLEWGVVIIIGAEEGTLPNGRNNVDIEEERRLMFVAMTRAKEILWITWANQRNNSWTKKTKKVERSRFVNESLGERKAR